nr:MAG TPA: hypothetical protein [Caudoviricetes sp.]
MPPPRISSSRRLLAKSRNCPKITGDFCRLPLTVDHNMFTIV